jgi:hypothetical protein
MIPVSEKWGRTILNPDVARKFSETAIIALENGIYQASAVRVETSGAQGVSQNAQLYNSILTTGYPYADADGTWTIASGRMAASSQIGEAGFVGATVCDQNGVFTPYVWLRMQFNAAHNVNAIYLAFDDKLGQYATQFDIVFLNADETEIGCWVFSDNTKTVFDPLTEKDAGTAAAWAFRLGNTALGDRLGQGTNKMPDTRNVSMVEIRIYKWNAPGTTAKVVEFSAERNEVVRGDDRIINAKIDMELIPDNIEPGYIPSKTISLTLDNGDNRYTPQSGIIGKEPMSNKRIAFFCGLEYEDGTVEEIQCGTFYIDAWTVNQSAKTVTIQASDIISRLDKIEYIKTDAMKYPANLKQIAEDIFNAAGFGVVVQAEAPYEKVIVDTEPDWGNGVTCREAMQVVANRVNGEILQGWDGSIRGYAQVSDKDSETSFNWTEYLGGYKRYITQDGYFNVEISDYDKSRTINACRLCYGAESQNKEVYWLYNDVVDKYGTNLFTAERTAITKQIANNTDADRLCRGILATNNFWRRIVKVEYRGDMAIELRDCVVVRSVEGKDLWGLVTKKSMEFDGGYREVLEVLV